MEQRLPNLDARLGTIASMVREGSVCADIGTDHGYLIAWLAASGKIPFGYACDINEKPLQRAAFTLSEYRVKEKVKLVLANGLEGLRDGDAQDIVIAGMGGDLIWEILSAPRWTRQGDYRFLLQPMSKPEHLRRRLWENGFAILRETAVVSAGFPYSVMQAAYTGQRREISPAEAYVGSLLDDRSPAAVCYVGRAAKLVREKVDGLSRARQAGDALRFYQELLQELEGGALHEGTGCL